ncbi:DUF4012 domain-containing protein [Antrihabitans sp. YC2-6]|uniref:DUF4012 domain-containing protein n=1 Tax=Antrihabitans sp. YC2-6 TaxID=2799498 RepID=UPI0018F455E3|nr:DUF4012 domain-containing protein [Antrihabitans sp. YC2-6]MBJ8348708.1 DUF4012 domain-containing protein [Antrihabitans sp. YC2-6]
MEGRSEESRRAGRRLSPRRLWSKVRARPRLATAVGVVALFVLTLCVWLGYSLLGARSAIDDASEHAENAKSALLRGDTAIARQEASDAQDSVADARAKVGSAPLSWLGAIPGVGSPVVTVEEMSDVAYRLLDEVLVPLVDSPASTVLSSTGGERRVDLAALRDSIPALNDAVAPAASVAQAADEVPRSSWFGRVNNARDSLVRQTADLAEQLGNVSRAAPVLPQMLGADGPRNYLMVFQTNAEARGTGGILGGTAILHVENGAIKVEKPASNLELQLHYNPIDLGPEFQKMYGQWDATANWQNANFSPHFPYAAAIWRSIWAQHTGLTVDGVIATDPVALSYLLFGAGPVTLPNGEVIDSSNVVPITQNEAYFKFRAESEQPARKEYLQEISKAVIDAVNSPSDSMKTIVAGLGVAIDEGRLAVWSAHPEEQQALESLPIAHLVPTDPAPYANVIVNNGAGGKLDYYLQRAIGYWAGPCAGPTRDSAVSVVLTNTAPPGLDYPSYLVGRRTAETQYEGPPGTNRSIVSLFATEGATLKKVTINGIQLPFALTTTERGHPVYTVPVVIEPEKSATVIWEMTEPTAPGTPQLPVQPLVLPAAVALEVPTCS